MSHNVIKNWLKFLDVDEYSDSFIDNGYDDLETVKLIERKDLEAIGVVKKDHQDYLLASVQILRENGAAWVYLLYDDTLEKSSEDCYSGSENTGPGSSGIESNKSSLCRNSEDTDSTKSNNDGNRFSTPLEQDILRGKQIKNPNTTQQYLHIYIYISSVSAGANLVNKVEQSR